MQNEERRRWTLMFSLARVSLLIVALAAALGWAASFVGLHDYGVRQLYGFTDVTAWFIPGAIDGAAFATSLMTYRANIKGRAAIRGRLLMWGFTAASGWINWIHQVSPQARFVAAGLPVAAVAVFDIVLIELRADYEERHGRRAFRLRPGLLLLRYMVDRRGTSEAFRRQIEAIPVASLAGLGNDLLADASRRGQIIPKAWLDLPQAKVTPLAPQRALESAVAERRAQGLIVPAEWHVLPHAEVPELPAPRAELEAPPELPQQATDRLSQPGESTVDDGPEQSTSDKPDAAVTESVDSTAGEPHQGAQRSEESEQPTEQKEPVPADDTETTAKIPVVAKDHQGDEREAARELVRRDPSRWTGKSLGDRFGKSPRWGRTQIKAVRQEQEQQERQRPQLVAVDS